jgi:hypothetical protein
MSKESYSKGRVSSLKNGGNKIRRLRLILFKVFLCVTLVLLTLSCSGNKQEGKRTSTDTSSMTTRGTQGGY